jgi:methylmalonyl-CoA mutase N-terminal domain/subunit
MQTQARFGATTAARPSMLKHDPQRTFGAKMVRVTLVAFLFASGPARSLDIAALARALPSPLGAGIEIFNIPIVETSAPR